MYIKEQKEDYRIFVTLLVDKYNVNDVLCKIFLPKRLTEPIELYFYPDKEQRSKLENIFEFSIIGELKGFSGKLETRIQSDKVYFKTGSTVHWGHNIAESVFIGEPIDLRVRKFLYRNVEDSLQKTEGSFWLTPSVLLSPAKTVERSYNGNVKVETIRQFNFTLANGFSLVFDKQFRYIKNENNDDITFTELVAGFEIGDEKQDINDTENDNVGHLDDFLMLVSFAERYRCICLGWDFINSEGHTKYYRRNLTIPKIREKQNVFETLIDIQDFDDFIKQTYSKFIEINPKDLIRQAIQYTTYREDRSLENSFFTLYAALETLMLCFRQNHRLDAVFDSPDEWNRFQEDLKAWLKIYSQLNSDKNKRTLVYEKIPELNRISFATVVKRLCDFYSVDLGDLWPLLKNPKGISLSEIRNMLVHGKTFNPLQLRALIVAKEHLLWIMERLILAVLGWPISRSRVNKDYLAHYMACYKDWEKDQKILSQTKK
jgi:hypothetical protein